MSDKKEIHVKIGEVKIGKKGDLLRATLGSCVGIAFIWREKGMMGLAHCLLPEAADPTYAIGAKFVSQAVPSLMALLKVQPEDVDQIEVYIVGGGNMMSQLARRNVDHIGMQNISAAKKYLKSYGIHFKEIDTGGEVGHQVFVDCSSGVVTVTRLQKAA